MKKSAPVLALTVGLLAALVSPTAAAQTPTARYVFAGTASDLSGNRRHATLLGAASIGEAALSIPENATGRVRIPESAVNGLGDFSVTALVSITPNHTAAARPVHLNTVLSGASAADDNVLQIGYRAQHASWQVYLGSPSATNSAQAFAVRPGIRPITGAWVHIAYVRRTTEGITTGTFYQNGVALGAYQLTAPASRAALNVAPDGLVIGQDQDAVDGGYQAGQSLKGLVAELTIYNGGLAAEQVADLARQAASAATGPVELSATAVRLPAAQLPPSVGAPLPIGGSRAASPNSPASALVLEAYPNPAPAGAALTVTVRGLRAEPTAVEVTLTDALGRPVRRASVMARDGVGQQQLPLTHLPAGAYVVRLLLPATGETRSRPLLVQ